MTVTLSTRIATNRTKLTATATRSPQSVLVGKIVCEINVQFAQANPWMATNREHWSANGCHFGEKVLARLSQLSALKGVTWNATPAPVAQKTAATKQRVAVTKEGKKLR